KSWSIPTTPHFSSSSPYLRAYVRMAYSTARACLRRLSLWVHSHSRFQASSRVGVRLSPEKCRANCQFAHDLASGPLWEPGQTGSLPYTGVFFYIDSFGKARG